MPTGIPNLFSLPKIRRGISDKEKFSGERNVQHSRNAERSVAFSLLAAFNVHRTT
jgi:hypothetical protein